MKRITLLLILGIISTTSCNQETLNSNNNNSEFLLSNIYVGSSEEPRWTYNYDENNQVESIIYNNNPNTTYFYSYDNTSRLVEIIQSPANFFDDGTQEDGYIKTTFSYTNENDFVGYFEYFDNENIVFNDFYIKYSFEGDLLKSYKIYANDENNPIKELTYYHDNEGRLTHYDEFKDWFVPNRVERTEIISWIEDSKPFTLNFSKDPFFSYLRYFPNKYISTNLMDEFTTYDVDTNTGEPISASNSTLFYNYEYDNDNNIIWSGLGSVNTFWTYDYMQAN
ncbi:hypothetical protein [uncultured Winogradskyella sp.]|uniref:hypothetical protein n=1 Tax=uncultured Winogradskyella sp. TaxID=395353 RepID=UPI00262F58DC|nr:hypothetical protein [uncultured Winogradskyella sp.]